MIKENRKYWIWLSVYVFAIFILNINHINQQGVYENFFRQISENVLSGAGYTCGEFDYKPTFYPLWGYTGILIIDTFFGSSNFFVYLIQFGLCLFSIFIFYKLFEIKPKFLHFPFLLPFIALCSVKWPDAIVGCLLIGFAYFYKKHIFGDRYKNLLIAGAMLGIIANFRSEYIYLPIVLLALSFLPFAKNFKKKNIITSVGIFAIAVACLLPWSFRSYILTGEQRLSASNGWAVMYISLGQLPGNPWHIAPYDKWAFDLTTANKKHPYTPEGDKLLKSEFTKLVKEQPLAFAEKFGLNSLRFFTGGVYTGEFANIILDESKRYELDGFIMSKSGIVNKIFAFKDFKLTESLPLIFEKFIQFCFVLTFFILMIYSIKAYFKNGFVKGNEILLLLSAAVVIYKFLIVSAIQYEYRHVNAIYLFVFGIAALQFEGWLAKRKSINAEVEHSVPE